MAITGKAESVSEYSETRIDVRVKKVLTSADPDVDRSSRYGVVDTDHPCGVASGGHLSNQVAEHIGAPASGDTSHVVKAPGLLLMTQEVELRFPFAGVSHSASVMMPGGSEAA